MKNPSVNPSKKSPPGSNAIAYSTLSARELEPWVNQICETILGSRVERVFVPESASHPDGYFKKEWVLELRSPSISHQLFISLRVDACGLFLAPAKTLKPAGTATRSGFDLSLAKSIVGRKITAVQAIKNERCIRLEFGGDDLELFLVLIPAQPEAVLLADGAMAGSTRVRDRFDPPLPRELTQEQLDKIPYRADRLKPMPEYARNWLKTRAEQALELRKKKIHSDLNQQIDSISKKIKSLIEQKEQTLAEPDWLKFGSLLQTHFHSQPKIEKNADQRAVYRLMDYETDQTVELPADQKLGLKQQLERYFHLAKRKRARLLDSESRADALSKRLPELRARLHSLDDCKDLAALLELIPEARAVAADPARSKSSEQKKLAEFSGRIYQSKEGLTILSGRNATENLELTFKIARGNDLWLHVKGRPGSHTVILLPPKKTASLETLLDAAHLCILYSGGKDWGKTEVDYTQRKYVKKIKNQTEVSYTNNKTLSVSMDPERVKQLRSDEKS